MHGESLNLREAIVFLFAAGVLVPLARRLRISPVLGFLLAGLAIGPYGLVRLAEDFPWVLHFTISDLEGVRLLAEFGVVFLLFMIGLELSPDRLWAMRNKVFGLGGLQIIITGSLISGIAYLFENTLAVAVVLGASFALSSTAIVVQLLSEKSRLGTAVGRTSFAILLCQDLAVLPILFLVGAFAAQSDASVLMTFVWALGQATLAVAAILLIGRLVIRPLFRFVGNTDSREMFLALVLLVIIGTAIATDEVGLSMALGAFLAGLLFSETEYRHEIEVDIEPFKGLLLGLFFVSVGMSIDIAQMVANPVWLFASVFGLYLVKCPVIYLLSRWFGDSHPVALEAALLLGQGGEFAFIVVGLAFGLGLIPFETAQFMLLVTGLTMVISPLVANLARRLSLAAEDHEDEHSDSEPGIAGDLSGHVIVVGYGRVGQMLGSIMDAQGLPHVGMDTDAALVARFRASGAGVFFGDGSRPELLKKLGADKAAALVVTMDRARTAERVISKLSRDWPELAIFARAKDRAHAARLIVAGASHAVPETLESSLQLSEMVLIGIGIPDHAARSIIQERRQAEQAEIDAHRPFLSK